MLEALIAILILALVLIGAAPAFFYGAQLVQLSSVRRQAVEEASDQMESLVQRDYGQIQSTAEPVQLTLGETDAGLSVDVTDLSAWDGKKVWVYVRWPRGNVRHEVKLCTLVSREGAGR